MLFVIFLMGLGSGKARHYICKNPFQPWQFKFSPHNQPASYHVAHSQNYNIIKLLALLYNLLVCEFDSFSKPSKLLKYFQSMLSSQ